MSDAAIHEAIKHLNPASVDWLESISLPIKQPPPTFKNPATDRSLAEEIQSTYNLLAVPGAITASGGFVAASKAFHCIFPDLGPIIDGRHFGLSYYHIARTSYTPPLGLTDWQEWLGTPMPGIPNPSPRGAGRSAWGWERFMAALGVNQHIYELWQASHGHSGIDAFLALDPETSGIPRIIDKVLW